MEQTTTPVIPELIAASPLVIGPFDRYWLSQLIIQLPDIDGEATVTAAFIPYRRDGSVVTSPPIPPVKLTAANLFATAEQDPELLAAIQAIGQAVLKMGVAQGLLAVPDLTQILP